MDMMDRISAYRELIRKNIDYENYPPIYNKQEVDELIELIVEIPNCCRRMQEQFGLEERNVLFRL